MQELEEDLRDPGQDRGAVPAALAEGAEPRQRQGQEAALDRRGGRAAHQAGREVRPAEVDLHRRAPARTHRQAVPRALAQPPEPAHQEVALDRRGGVAALPLAPRHGQPLGRDRQVAAGAHGQLHQEPLELLDEEAHPRAVPALRRDQGDRGPQEPAGDRQAVLAGEESARKAAQHDRGGAKQPQRPGLLRAHGQAQALRGLGRRQHGRRGPLGLQGAQGDGRGLAGQLRKAALRGHRPGAPGRGPQAGRQPAQEHLGDGLQRGRVRPARGRDGHGAGEDLRRAFLLPVPAERARVRPEDAFGAAPPGPADDRARRHALGGQGLALLRPLLQLRQAIQTADIPRLQPDAEVKEAARPQAQDAQAAGLHRQREHAALQYGAQPLADRPAALLRDSPEEAEDRGPPQSARDQPQRGGPAPARQVRRGAQVIREQSLQGGRTAVLKYVHLLGQQEPGRPARLWVEGQRVPLKCVLLAPGQLQVREPQ